DLLGWDLERIEAAITGLDEQLRRCGLRLHRINGQLTIARSIEACDQTTVRDTVRVHLLRAGLNVTEANLLKRIADGKPPREPSNAESVALGVLSNAQLLDAGGVLADDLRYSLLLVE